MKTKKSDSKQYPFLLSCIGSYVLTFDIISHHLILQFRDALYFRMRHKRCRPFIRLLQHLLFCAGIKVCLSKPSLVRINLFFILKGNSKKKKWKRLVRMTEKQRILHLWTRVEVSAFISSRNTFFFHSLFHFKHRTWLYA